MKTFALCLAFTAAFAAPAAFAKPAPAQSTLTRSASADAPLGKDGQSAGRYCSSHNPNIEYRDCVNASTRDPNAKVRMG